jgi:beta-lactamase regulating signal transducer with metallopeptidase domain
MDKVFLQILNLSISASYVILAVIVLRLVLKKAPKAIVCALWVLVGLRLALPLSIESVTSLIPSSQTISPDIVYASQPTISSGVEVIDEAINPVISQSLAPVEHSSVNPMQILGFALSSIWLMGMVLMLGYSAFSYIRLRLRVREAVRIEKGVRQGAMVDSPFVLGLLRPMIYLPANISETDKAMVLSHERAHLRRGDNWIKPAGFLLLAVHWFNPLVWLAYILLCRDIELACDEKVLKEQGAAIKKEYSTALLNCSCNRKAISVCPLAFGEVGVKTRIKSVLSYKKPAFWLILIAVLCCVIFAICFMTNPVKAEEAAESPVDVAIDEPESGNASIEWESNAPASPITDGVISSSQEPSFDASLNFVIPLEGEGRDYAPASLSEVEGKYVDSRAAAALQQMLNDCRAAGNQVEIFRAYEEWVDPDISDSDFDSVNSSYKHVLQSGLCVLFARYENGDNYQVASGDDFEAQVESMNVESAQWDDTLVWLKEHCADYGFVQRWSLEKQDVQGLCTVRPSMFRYVGVDAARYMTANDLVLEEYVAENCGVVDIVTTPYVVK